MCMIRYVLQVCDRYDMMLVTSADLRCNKRQMLYLGDAGKFRAHVHAQAV